MHEKLKSSKLKFKMSKSSDIFSFCPPIYNLGLTSLNFHFLRKHTFKHRKSNFAPSLISSTVFCVDNDGREGEGENKPRINTKRKQIEKRGK